MFASSLPQKFKSDNPIFQILCIVSQNISTSTYFSPREGNMQDKLCGRQWGNYLVRR